MECCHGIVTVVALNSGIKPNLVFFCDIYSIMLCKKVRYESNNNVIKYYGP